MKAPEDIVDRLQVLADLQAGDVMPDWLLIDKENRWSWAAGMSKTFNEAIAEIRRLRKLTDGTA